eukprot:288296_1
MSRVFAIIMAILAAVSVMSALDDNITPGRRLLNGTPGISGLLSMLEPYLQDMFNKADMGGVGETEEGDGKVTFDEVANNIDGVDGSHADHVLFDVVDNDDDGYVTFQEFKQFVQYFLMQQLSSGNTSGTPDPASIAQAIQNMIIAN